LVALRKDPSELSPPPADGLPTRGVHAYARDKLYYWGVVSNACARVTKNKWMGRRACVDPFASCGINQDLETGALSWGSALLALQVQDPFDTYVFGDRDGRACEALAQRCEALALPGAEVLVMDATREDRGRQVEVVRRRSPPGPKIVIMKGDANETSAIVKMLLPGFAQRRYVLAMVDPPSACFEWQALAKLTLHERLDLMLLFPEDFDLERNLGHEARLDRYFGTPVWRQAVAGPGSAGVAMRMLYKRRLRDDLGYQLADDKAVLNARGIEIYKFLFASKDKLGVKLWNESTRRRPNGQDAFYFPGL
jgi:three-Cys-motif partner protein